MGTTLSSERVSEVESLVETFLKQHDSITNRKLREISGVNYDQAIYFFNLMVDRGQLQRTGKASGTKYVLGSRRGSVLR